MDDAEGFGFLWHHAERQTVDHDRAAFRHIMQMRVRGRPCQRRGPRKALAEIEHLRPPAEFAQLRNHTLVISITAGRGVEVARRGKDQIALHQSGASYQARAFGDSPTVTRIAEISRGARPSLPAFTASANWSNTQRVSHSVVVLTPLNCGMSSRFL